ncbi:hypothetical protein Aau02nite_57360 [Amorphoplanes auranticolor]|uniref:Uncharacterized protein n=1 Tax=Actinoplanes auranticolor TaxID=47988 RepID=A0A919SL45_9ACTN|nr:hypothetical protein Aau02nite_57360 [Actinoplanes auranticolor]
MPNPPSPRFSQHITQGPGRPPRHTKREHTMNDWTIVADTIGDLLNLAAAIITLIAVRSQPPRK